MRIGVIDSDCIFENDFFRNKKIELHRLNPGYTVRSSDYPFSHGEYVCASILTENPVAELVVYNILGEEKKTGQLFYDSLNALINEDDIDIINISAGIEENYFQELFELCEKANCPIIAAHENTGKVSYPAAFLNVIGVSTSNEELGNNLFQQRDKYEILFHKKAFVSFKQLGQEHLMHSNSFCTAKLTGMISCCLENGISNPIQFLEEHITNRRMVQEQFQENEVLFLTNRSQEHLQQRFIKDCFGNPNILDWNTTNIEQLEIERKGLLFIDIDSYSEFQAKKQELIRFLTINEKKFRKIVSRYPMFSRWERILLYQSGVFVEHMYL